MKGLSDTSPDVERRMVEAYRRMPTARRWQNLCEDYAFARSLHATGMRSRNPKVTMREIQSDWIRSTLGHPLPMIGVSKMEPYLQNIFAPLHAVIRVFEQMGIPYAIGGSIASSMHGIGRLTRDADLSVLPFPGREQEFAKHFPEPEYYLSIPSITDAFRHRSTFNILHVDSGFKIDLFVQKDEPFERSTMARRVPVPTPDEPNQVFYFLTPEDIVLHKLRWYRLGDEVSDRQWNDILGVMRAKAAVLEESYLDHWAAELGVGDLLTRARADAIIPG